MKRRIVSPGEALALDHRYLRSDSKAIWWDLPNPIAPNEYVETDAGNACIVHVRGGYEHHDSGFGDSYDALRCRFAEAFDSDCEWIVACIDCPGGVVSGLNEFVRWMRAESERCGKDIHAYVDELAASGGYAIACGCASISAPKSAIVGSIGVISTMHDQTAADKKMGLRFVTIASGDRKTDGHPHVSISDDAIAVEESRVKRLAGQFYRLVSEARPMPLGELKSTRGFQAGIFLAEKAAAMGLVDEVSSWDEFLVNLTLDNRAISSKGSKSTQVSKGNETDRRADEETTAMLKFSADLKRLEARIASEKDPDAKAALMTTAAALRATIEAAKKIVHEKHEKKTVNSDDGEDEDNEAEGEEDEESAEHDEPDGDEDDDDDDDPDKDKDGDDEEESNYSEEEDEEAAKQSEEEEASLARRNLHAVINASLDRKAAVRAVRGAVRNALARERARLMPLLKAAAKLTKQSSLSAIVGALDAMPKQQASDETLRKRVAQLESDKRKTVVDRRIDSAFKSGKITKSEIPSLRAAGMRDPKWLKGNLDARPKIVRQKGEGFVPRDGTEGGAPSNSEQAAMMAAATKGMSPDECKAFESEVSQRLANTNGAPRY